VEQSTSQEGRSSVLVLDAKALRRAETACFLQEWAVANGVSILALAPGELRGALDPDARFALGVLNMGAASLAVASHLAWLKDLLEVLPETPAAVLSDLESAEEAVLALRAGARGFLPTSTEPEIALKALSFIMKGGSFFPPSALLEKDPVRLPRIVQIDPGHLHSDAPRRLAPLTARQLAVLAHLQIGMSNKVIGSLLGLREATVKDHVRHIMRKLGATNRTQAALAVDIEAPLISLPGSRKLD
jgi:DNA-binding NarL/FixJ family response regulator